MNELHRRVVRGTLSNYLSTFLMLAVGFLTTPFVLGHLGDAEYGLWVLVGSFVAYGSLLDFGVSGAIIKYIAQHRANGALDAERRMLTNALALAVCLSATTIGLAALASVVFLRVFNVSADLAQTAPRLVFLMGCLVAITNLCAIPTSVLQGLQRFDAVSALNAAGFLLAMSGVLVVLALGHGVVAMVGVYLSTTVAMVVPGVWTIKRLAPDVSIDRRELDARTAKKLAVFGSSLFLMDVAGRLETKTDELVIGATMPVASVTPFALARRLSEITQLLATRFLRVLLPLASELHASDEAGALRALHLASTRLTLALGVPTGTITLLLAGPVLSRWVGAEYASYAHLVVILTVSGIIDMSTWPIGSTFQGIGKMGVLAVVSLMTGISNLVLSVVLAKRYGLTGVAVGTLAPTAVFCLGFVWPYALRHLDIGVREVLREVVLRVALPLVPLLLVVVPLARVTDSAGIAGLVLCGGAGMAAYAVGYYGVGAGTPECAAARAMIVALRHRSGERVRSARFRGSR